MEAIRNYIRQFEGDITHEVAQEVHKAGVVAWDIETSGLEWREDKIGTCQLYVPGNFIAIVKLKGSVPQNLRDLLSEPKIQKIFHHALFDLRFMSYAWQVRPQNIKCTRIAAKLINISDTREYGLKHLLHHYLGVEISKDEQISDWLAPHLTESQIIYAAQDVFHLPKLLPHLERALEAGDLSHLAQQCFDHIPARVRLDIMGYPDVFVY